ncbi:MAG: penicillin-binding protein 2 [SAR86 cluster bacterium]|uniref:Penicillin-binding protein 2 n=1 Tax=SAR86 cluster bacterium TaxID=2030880 RepID=A0A520N0Q4_9GAMM|nr:MAG: penicillin-binding protein 2 [SAR86 cluster bacterium]|tara:strand:- start:821 stop:2440 length:1620 start_codon:yes stop_codon:yes gene_type:complete
MKNKITFLNWRFLFIVLSIALFTVIVIVKILSIQISDSIFLQNEGAKRYIKYKEIVPTRGTIFDRNNFPLAVSVVNYDLYALKGFQKKQLLKLSKIFELDTDFSVQKFSKKTLLKKNITNEEILLLKKLKLSSIEVESRHSRHYPLGDQISPLIGFFGKDGAQEGLEKSYDNVLSGLPGRQKYFKNAKQELISQPIELVKLKHGSDVHLTIDATIQFYAYKHLVEGIKSNKAKSGTVIILDNKKGEVLAMASYPSYNPNHPKRKIQKNRALVDAYELGSVLKPIVLSKAIENKVIAPNKYIDIPRRLNLNDKIIVDSKAHEQLTPKEIISVSSQIGASKIALELGYKDLKDNYYDYGFTKPISINFPSSALGYINVKENVSKKELASLGYGYGLTISPFQIASAYSVFANEGIFKDFKLLQNSEVTSRKIISSDTAKHILEALNMVIKDGTGKAAEIKGFSEGGKTGTVHRIKRGSGYAEDSYRASFVGITPLNNESLTIFVSIDEPDLNLYSGGAVAAPVFAKIAESSLNYLGYFQDE